MQWVYGVAGRRPRLFFGRDDEKFAKQAYPARARSALAAAIVAVVAEFGDRLVGSFVVVEPGRARLGRPI